MACENCTICLEPLSGDIRTLACGHKFHTACMRQWENRNHHCTCPNCREHVQQSEPIPRPPSGSPPMRRRRNNRPSPTRWPAPPAGLNLVPPWMMHAHNLENAGIMAATDFMDNIENRIHRSLGENPSDLDIKMVSILAVCLIIILGVFLGVGIANDTCMCKYSWPADATMITVDGWFGGTITYYRPPICTNWC